jgi:hypothetical protein
MVGTAGRIIAPTARTTSLCSSRFAKYCPIPNSCALYAEENTLRCTIPLMGPCAQVSVGENAQEELEHQAMFLDMLRSAGYRSAPSKHFLSRNAQRASP